MKMIKWSLLFTLAMMLVACPKNKEKDDATDPVVAPETAPAETGTDDAANSGKTQAQIEAEQLEAQRKKVEEMINRIMSEDVYFDYDKATLTEKARELLTQVGDILIAEKKFRVEVEGHTDERGTEDYNMSLGAKRAQTVQKYLVNYGVAADRMQTMSYGEEKPKVEGEGEEAYSKNRRASFRVKVIEQ